MASKVFMMKLSEIQPSQLYICSEKLSEVMKTFDANSPMAIEPIPVKRLGDDVTLLTVTQGLSQPSYTAFQRFQSTGRMKSWTGTPTGSVSNGVRRREYAP